MMIIRFCITVVIAFFVGKLVSKFKLPSILGWLITGMVLGPHGFSMVGQEILDTKLYHTILHILECTIGLMIGTEFVFKKLKKFGKAIIITTLTQSLGTFLIVSLVFGIVLHFSHMPIYLAFIFGGIALATAPAPAISVVREFKTDGPVTRTLIPMAALDDIVGFIVFFSVIGTIAGNLSGGKIPAYMIVFVIMLPLIIGGVIGFIAGFILKKERSKNITFVLLIITILIASGIGFLFNNIVNINFMLIGMAFSAIFANMVSDVRLEQIMHSINPFIGISIIIVILNLGIPLDYHLILGAGMFTAIYIIARAFGKYFGAYFGASITKSPETVKKFLGLALLPHSGVSLIFTGIAVSVLNAYDPESTRIVQGTIAAAAVINEVIAVIVAKKGFELAGEFGKLNCIESDNIEEDKIPIVITINRQYGSGGREIGRKLSENLGIPFYDSELIELAVKSSSIDKDFYENIENIGMESVLHDLSSNVQSNFSMEDQAFLHNSKVIQDIAYKGSCVIIGRCADYILKNRKNVIKVFISSDMESRKYRIENIYKEASEINISEIEKKDKNRASYYQFYSGSNFSDVNNYDICLSSSTLGIDECVNIIQSMYNTLN